MGITNVRALGGNPADPSRAREVEFLVTRKMGTATFEYLGVRGDSLVMFGEPGDAALLGATTLEGFGLILDPFRRELKTLPMHF